jgi:DNA-binding transcriptional ArsR family regulator
MATTCLATSIPVDSLQVVMELTSSDWVEVDIPSPKPFLRNAGVRKANEARRLRTKVNKDRLLEILTAPPSDYDGSNKKLAEYMGMSERTVTRLLALMNKEGLIKLTNSRRRSIRGGVFTHRMIQLKRSI